MKKDAPNLKDLLRPIKDQIHKLWSRVDGTPIIRWGTVTQVTPLLVQLDGDFDLNTGDPITTPGQLPASVSVTVGQRVVCAERDRRVIVLA